MKQPGSDEREKMELNESRCSEEADFLPVAQLGEDEVKRKASSQPGQAAQHRHPGNTGHLPLRWASLTTRF